MPAILTPADVLAACAELRRTGQPVEVGRWLLAPGRVQVACGPAGPVYTPAILAQPLDRRGAPFVFRTAPACARALAKLDALTAARQQQPDESGFLVAAQMVGSAHET